MGIFQNSWVIGIVTGIISGILVFFITKLFINRKDKTEYYRKVKSANDEVIAALKPYIADKGLPSHEVFESLIASTARIHQVQQTDMYSIEDYCEELIREIISDIYVSNDKKEQYTNSLAEYKHQCTQKKTKIELQKAISDIELREMKSKYNNRLSVYLSMFVALFGGIVTSIISMTDLLDVFSSESSYFILIPFLILALVVTLLTVFKVSELVFQKIKDKNNDEDTDDNTKSKK